MKTQSEIVQAAIAVLKADRPIRTQALDEAIARLREVLIREGYEWEELC